MNTIAKPQLKGGVCAEVFEYRAAYYSTNFITVTKMSCINLSEMALLLY